MRWREETRLRGKRGRRSGRRLNFETLSGWRQHPQLPTGRLSSDASPRGASECRVLICAPARGETAHAAGMFKRQRSQEAPRRLDAIDGLASVAAIKQVVDRPGKFDPCLASHAKTEKAAAARAVELFLKIQASTPSARPPSHTLESRSPAKGRPRTSATTRSTKECANAS